MLEFYLYVFQGNELERHSSVLFYYFNVHSFFFFRSIYDLVYIFPETLITVYPLINKHIIKLITLAHKLNYNKRPNNRLL